MKILMVGDVVGKTGRRFFAEQIFELRRVKNIDVIIVNGENAAHGRGLTPKIFEEFLTNGADVVTSGNHIWDNPNISQIIDTEPFLLRPANYPEDSPGKGFCIYPFKTKKIGVINLLGRVFIQPPISCPFITATNILNTLEKECNIILIDFHAEATSEKEALAYYLDGKVTAIIGTHTHVQTADERILPKGTAYITDLGMVGTRDSVLGISIDTVIKRFVTSRPSKFEVAEGLAIFCALLIEIDDSTNKAINVERILIHEEKCICKR